MIGMLYFAVGFVKALLSFMNILVFSSCILSNVPTEGMNSFILFVTRLGDLILLPVKRLCKRVRIIDSMPFDVTYIIAFVGLHIMEVCLPTLTLS